jgi:hypothetical protein
MLGFTKQRHGLVLGDIQRICPEGLTAYGQRNQKTFEIAYQLARQGLSEQMIIPALWEWSKAQVLNSRTIQADPDHAYSDLVRQVGNVCTWRREFADGRSSPVLRPDPEETEIFRTLCNETSAVSEAMATVLLVFRLRRMRPRDRLPLSREYLKQVTGRSSPATLARIRAGLVRTGVIRLVRFASKVEGRAQVVEILRTQLVPSVAEKEKTA